jgi:Flp pilus assembly pilin Flp
LGLFYLLSQVISTGQQCIGILNAIDLSKKIKLFIHPPNIMEGLVMESIRRFLGDETGVTAAEYGIILGSIAGILILGIVFFYTELGNLFSRWGTWFSTKTPS